MHMCDCTCISEVYEVCMHIRDCTCVSEDNEVHMHATEACLCVLEVHTHVFDVHTSTCS